MPAESPSREARIALRDAKQAMRARVVAARNAMEPGAHAAGSQAIAAHLLALASFRDARTVLVTLPFGSEWDVRPLAQHALAAGKTVVIPRVDAQSRMLVLHAVRDIVHDVAPGFRAIPEPLAATPVVPADAIDWVLVPGVAFDANGARLGYGGGYYDRLLPLLGAKVPRLAGAFDLQIVPEVPSTAHDAHVDAIATPTRLIVAAGARP